MRFPRVIRAGRLVAMLFLSAPAGLLGAQPPAAGQSAGGPAPSSAGQTPLSTAPTLSVDARLVNIPVVVRDKKGALVTHLTKDNFVLQVDGHPQTIRYFNVDTDLPLTLGLLVDTSQSQRDVLAEEKTASLSFLDNMLNGPDGRDKAFVVQFARQTDLLQDVTSSKPKLQAAVKQLQVPSLDRNAGAIDPDPDADNSTSGRLHRMGVGTTLYDALFLSSDEILGKQKGRKAVVILSDGGDFGSKETVTEAIEAAQRADTIVYAIYFKGKETPGALARQGGGGRFPGSGGGGGRGGGGYPGGGGGYPGGGGGQGGGGQGGGQRGGTPEKPRVDGKKVLEQMADETGGRMFEVTKKQTVADIYAQIGEELRAQYRLGYSPDTATASDGYHRIELTLAKGSPKDDYVQTRDGYYTGK